MSRTKLQTAFDNLPDADKWLTVQGLTYASNRLRNLAEGLEERLPPDYTPEQILAAVRVALCLTQANLAEIDPDSSHTAPEDFNFSAWSYAGELVPKIRRK